MELVKIRLQNQDTLEHTAYKGPIDCIKQIVRKNGIRGIFKGLGSTLLRETPSYGAYFASYEIMHRALLPEDADPSHPSMVILLAGGIAGVIGWLSTYPVDVVKTRLQSAQEDANPRYNNFRNAFRLIVKEEGYRVFTRGLGATALRAFPTNAATFFTVISVKNFINSRVD